MRELLTSCIVLLTATAFVVNPPSHDSIGAAVEALRRGENVEANIAVLRSAAKKIQEMVPWLVETASGQLEGEGAAKGCLNDLFDGDDIVGRLCRPLATRKYPVEAEPADAPYDWLRDLYVADCLYRLRAGGRREAIAALCAAGARWLPKKDPMALHCATSCVNALCDGAPVTTVLKEFLDSGEVDKQRFAIYALRGGTRWLDAALMTASLAKVVSKDTVALDRLTEVTDRCGEKEFADFLWARIGAQVDPAGAANILGAMDSGRIKAGDLLWRLIETWASADTKVGERSREMLKKRSVK